MGLSVLVLRGSGWAERSEERIPGGGVGVSKGAEVRNNLCSAGAREDSTWLEQSV